MKTAYTRGMGAGIWWGSLAATLALLLQLPLLENAAVTEKAVLVLLFSLPVLLVCLIWMTAAAFFVGLPVVTLLRSADADTAEVLALAGGLAGYGVIVVIGVADGRTWTDEASLIALTALVGGAVMGGTWGHHRDGLAQRSQQGCHYHAPHSPRDERILR